MPLREKQLIRKIRSWAAIDAGNAVVGIGDDCAILNIPKAHQTLVTTDFSLEGMHFRREWHPPQSVGHRCLARGLSDIAAMGGKPQAAFLSLAVPAALPQKWIDDFMSGFLGLAAEFSVTLAGGDTAQSPDGVLADIVVIGSVPRGTAVLRSGAHAGDKLYVTGRLGESVHALSLLREGKKPRPAKHLRHFYPEPRIEVGEWLRAKKVVSAMIDTSDGLSTDLQHICDESGVGATVYAERLPHVEADRDLKFALHGGEDYELLFTAATSKRIPRSIAGIPVTEIGEITAGDSIQLVGMNGRRTPLTPAGWEHFS